MATQPLPTLFVIRTCADGPANGLSLGRIHHAYLFSGTCGVGKTSIARLLAKGLKPRNRITARRVACDNCREIEQGALSISIDRRRLWRTKVEDTVTCWITCSTPLARGRFKVLSDR